RIWRKDTNDEVHLLSVFSPWHSGSTTTSEYRWQGDTLSLIELLKEKGALLHVEKMQHSYPCCWRHKTPIIFRATPQWFVS
ncbi:DUF1481 domain-containing protein, partial [Salmonella enterica subsp. enterica serovar Anatum]|nr:DUF1481 domain-containing protein [Salmonella enterica subsp. enterica serovar Anatum]